MSNVAVPAAPQSRSSNGAQTSQGVQGQKTGHQRINKVAVLGAGTMGARIAAHFANAGVPCVLLDIVTPDAAQSTDKAARRKLVVGGLEDRKSTRLNSSHVEISYAVFCLKKKK